MMMLKMVFLKQYSNEVRRPIRLFKYKISEESFLLSLLHLGIYSNLCVGSLAGVPQLPAPYNLYAAAPWHSSAQLFDKRCREKLDRFSSKVLYFKSKQWSHALLRLRCARHSFWKTHVLLAALLDCTAVSKLDIVPWSWRIRVHWEVEPQLKGVKKAGHQTENIKGHSSQHMLSPSHGPNGSQMMVHTSNRSNLKTAVLGKFSLHASAYRVLGFHLSVATGFHFPFKLH